MFLFYDGCIVMGGVLFDDFVWLCGGGETVRKEKSLSAVYCLVQEI